MGDVAWKWAFVFHIWKLKDLEWKQMFSKTICQNNSSNSQLSPELSKWFLAHSSLGDGLPVMGGGFCKGMVYLFIYCKQQKFFGAKVISVSLLRVMCFSGLGIFCLRTAGLPKAILRALTNHFGCKFLWLFNCWYLIVDELMDYYWIRKN